MSESLTSNQRLEEIRARVKEHKEAVDFGSTIFNQADLDRAALLEMIDQHPIETIDKSRDLKRLITAYVNSYKVGDGRHENANFSEMERIAKEFERR